MRPLALSSSLDSSHVSLPWRLPVMVILVTLALRLGSETTANIAYLVLAAYALTSPAAIIQSLALSWFMTMINPGIAPDASLGALGRYFVLFAAAASAMIHTGVLNRWRLNNFSIATLGIVALIIGHSVLFSAVPDVSILKATAWGIAIITLVATWSSFKHNERQAVFQQLYWGLVGVIIFSLPLLVMPVGFLRNGFGFQGLINQPQAFGLLVALVGAITLGRLLGEKKPSWWMVALGILCLMLILLSETRTAGVSFVLGLASAAIALPIITNRKPQLALPGLKSRRLYLLAFVAVMSILISGTAFTSIVSNFVAKGGRAEVSGLVQAYDQSRGFIMDAMIDNIQSDPLVGIGFGVPSDPFSLNIQRDPIFDLPIGASIEKGVMPLALLEELGVIGFCLFVAWFWMIVRSAARAGIVALSVTLTGLLINLGESIFFSPSGMGMLVLIFVSWAYSMGIQQCTKQAR